MPVTLVLPNFFLHLKAAVAVIGVAQGHDAAILQADVEIAVRGRDHVARGAQALGGDERAEPGGQLDATVIGIAGGGGGE